MKKLVLSATVYFNKVKTLADTLAAIGKPLADEEASKYLEGFVLDLMVEPLFFASLAFLFFALLWSSLMVYLRTWRFWRFLPSTFLLYSTLPRSLPNKGLLVFVIVQTLSRVTVVLS